MKIPIKKFSSVNYNDIYQRNISSLCLSIYSNKCFLLVYTKEITIENQGKKKIEKKTCY